MAASFHATGTPSPDSPTDVVTCFLRHRGEVLLVRRSGRVRTYQGRWGAISGYAESEHPLEDAWREIEEETGLQDAVTLVRQGEPFEFEDAERKQRWRVHPFLFDAGRRDAALDWEAVEGVWVAPTEILARPAVPRLWTSYRRVAPTLESVRDDREHGSAYLSLRALEVLRDRAGELAAAIRAGAEEAAGALLSRPASAEAAWGELVELGLAVREVRPAMTALRNRVNAAMAAVLGERGGSVVAGGDDASAGEGGLFTESVDEGKRAAGEAAAAGGPPSAVVPAGAGEAPSSFGRSAGEAASAKARLERAAVVIQERLQAAIAADDGASLEAARHAAGRRVLTLSLSGTVVDALIGAEPRPALVVVCESRPGGEGRSLAKRLAGAGIDTVLIPDAATAWALERERIELVLVGADTVLPDGAILNKVGTRLAALAAREAGIPFLAAAACDKIAASEGGLEAAEGVASDEARGRGSGGKAEERLAGRSVPWRAPLFERTAGELVALLVTEAGGLTAEAVRTVAAEHAALERWARGAR